MVGKRQRGWRERAGDKKLQLALSEYSNGRISIPQLAEPRAHVRNPSLDELGGSFNMVSEGAVHAT
jgi:hypothetical protein